MTDDRRIKIAYVTVKDHNDKNSWSGTNYRIAQALEKHCGDVYYVGPLKTRLRYITEKIDFLTSNLLGKHYAFDHNNIISKAYARKINRKLKEDDFDIIFAPAASTEIAHLEVDIPIIYLSDTTITLFFDYFKDYYSNLLDLSKKEAYNIEKSAINKADLLIYSSKWAADSAINDYGADESKVFVIPFGANIDKIINRKTVLNKKKSDVCKLLFLGVEWERKGGDIAFDTLLELEKLGIGAELTVCGVIPPEEFKHKNMNVIPFLDKNDKNQSKKLEELFLKSDFLLLPTRRDCTPIVYSEASSFGLPVITTDTGGVSGVITNGKNGFMLSLDAKGADYAKLIKEIYLDNELYYNLVKSSRKLFEEKLNWDTWGKTVSTLINDILK